MTLRPFLGCLPVLVTWFAFSPPLIQTQVIFTADQTPTPDPQAFLKLLNLSSSDSNSRWYYSKSDGNRLWQFNITDVGCQSARLHLSSFDLKGEDRLAVYGIASDGERVGEEIFRRNSGRDGDVFTHRVWADHLMLQFYASNSQSQFDINYVQYGDCDRSTDNRVGSVCGHKDWENAVCYATKYPDIYRIASGVVKLQYVHKNVVYSGTAFKVSDDGRFLTNYHCLRIKKVMPSVELMVHYDSDNCLRKQGHVSMTLHGDSLLWTSGSTKLDASIITVQEANKAIYIPCLHMSSSDPLIGRQIAIIQHPDGESKKIAIKSDKDVSGNCTIESTCEKVDYCYRCDTDEGSSGSPVVDFKSGNVVALHHFGGCPNSGVKISSVRMAAGNNMGVCSKDPVINAAVLWAHNNKTYFFQGSQYWLYDDDCDCVASGYPKQIGPNWKGLPNNLDAAVTSNRRTYFFKGSQYWKYDDNNNHVADGYPKDISSEWHLPNNLDAAIKHTNNKIYFFKGNQFWRYNEIMGRIDYGYPHTVDSHTWPGLPSNLDAAIVWSNGRSYFFKAKQYYRYKVLDGSYPKSICEMWKGMPCY